MEGTDECFDWLSAMIPRSLALLACKPDLPLVIRRDMVMTPHAYPGTLDGLELAGKAQIAYRPDVRRSTLDRLARCVDTDIKTAALRNPGVGLQQLTQRCTIIRYNEFARGGTAPRYTSSNSI